MDYILTRKPNEFNALAVSKKKEDLLVTDVVLKNFRKHLICIRSLIERILLDQE